MSVYYHHPQRRTKLCNTVVFDGLFFFILVTLHSDVVCCCFAILPFHRSNWKYYPFFWECNWMQWDAIRKNDFLDNGRNSTEITMPFCENAIECNPMQSDAITIQFHAITIQRCRIYVYVQRYIVMWFVVSCDVISPYYDDDACCTTMCGNHLPPCECHHESWHRLAAIKMTQKSAQQRPTGTSTTG